MKILKSLNRIFLLLVFVLFFNASSFSNEPVDIWNLDNNTKDNTDLDVQNLEQDEIILNETISKKKNDSVKVLVVRLNFKINEIFLKNFQNLKFIISNTTGLDHIDKKFCKSKNIKILSLNDTKTNLRNIFS